MTGPSIMRCVLAHILVGGAVLACRFTALGVPRLLAALSMLGQGLSALLMAATASVPDAPRSRGTGPGR